ncbi:hypothetical protein JOB18_027135 [Solea senegalensis]|uniref:Uncharacterized protein n=1 Tax=Solea senegalensis TaxID=28829 RepID=A0AAV6QIT8_SOLSE|nr:hypothetical protein JOB18_027135 [Solea senegalensis]
MCAHEGSISRNAAANQTGSKTSFHSQLDGESREILLPRLSLPSHHECTYARSETLRKGKSSVT